MSSAKWHKILQAKFNHTSKCAELIAWRAFFNAYELLAVRREYLSRFAWSNPRPAELLKPVLVSTSARHAETTYFHDLLPDRRSCAWGIWYAPTDDAV